MPSMSRPQYAAKQPLCRRPPKPEDAHPVATEKEQPPANDHTVSPTPAAEASARGKTARAKKAKPRPLAKGVAKTVFAWNAYDWDLHFADCVGTSTRTIELRGFTINDKHIHEILALGPGVCHKLKSFSCAYHASGLSDETMAAFAEACPNLTKVELQGVWETGEATLVAFFKYCPNLRHLEITGSSTSYGPRYTDATSAALETICQNPNWAPNLKKLLLHDNDELKQYNTALRKLSRARHPDLDIRLVRLWESRRDDVPDRNLIRIVNGKKVS